MGIHQETSGENIANTIKDTSRMASKTAAQNMAPETPEGCTMDISTGYTISLPTRKDPNITRLYGLCEEGEVEADMLKKSETVWALI
jgi:hypothetical protein